MQQDADRFLEIFSDSFNIQHKVTLLPEKRQYHIHRQLEIIYPLSDNLSCRLEDGAVPLPAGHFFLLNNMDLHFITRRAGALEQEPLDRYILYFAPEFLSESITPEVDLLECFYALHSTDAHIVPLLEGQEPFVLQLLERLARRAASGEGAAFGSALAQRVEFTALLLLIGQNFHQLHALPPGPANYQLVYDVIDYIHSHYTQPLHTAEIARQFFVSKSHLHALFHRITGSSPYEFIIKYRVSKAAELLAQGCSVARAEELVGYENLSHFSQVFRRRMGCSPKQYQRSCRP